MLVAIESGERRAGFIVMQQVSSVNREMVSQFVKQHLLPDQCVRSDTLPILAEISKTQNHIPRVTPPNKTGEWLPWVRVAIGNLSVFIVNILYCVIRLLAGILPWILLSF